MTRPVVEKNLKRSVDWSSGWQSIADQWMDNFHACRDDLIEECFQLELWRLATVTSWMVSVGLMLILVVQP